MPFPIKYDHGSRNVIKIYTNTHTEKYQPYRDDGSRFIPLLLFKYGKNEYIRNVFGVVEYNFSLFHIYTHVTGHK